MKVKIEKEIVEKEEQSGFRRKENALTTFVLQYQTERLLTKGRELHVTFIGLRKAFDSVPFQKLWTATANAVKALYRESRIMFASNTSSPSIQRRVLNIAAASLQLYLKSTFLN